jgi:general secretion pathway protein L
VTEKLVIQLVQDVLDDEGEVSRLFRWGMVDEFSNWHSDSNMGSDDDLLEVLENHSMDAILLIPGNKVVTLPVPFDKKEARHFRKLLPYQIEDEVLGSVDELHFAIGSKDSDVVSVAYVDEAWLANLLSWFKENNIEIDRCIADFQSLNAEDNELVLWFYDGDLWGRRGNGLGFNVSQPMLQSFLKDLLVNQQDPENPWQVSVYVDDAETKEIIESHIMPPVEYEVIVGQPSLNFDQHNQLDFCSGKFGKALPIDRWWQEAKPIALLAAASVAVFFVATFADIFIMKGQQEKYQKEIVDTFRTVQPSGRANDPVRRLKSMLGSGESSGESSQSVFLLSKIAPVMKQLKVELTTLNYSNREQALRINVKADSFNGIEQLRQELEKQGVKAELQSSNAADEGYQARLRVALIGGGARNG